MFKIILACLIYTQFVFLCFSFPIGKVTFKQLIETSSDIVVGYKKASIIKQVGEYDYVMETTFEVHDNLTQKHMDKYITISHASPYTVCPAPPKFEDKKLMLVFLIWDKKLNEYDVNSLSYGTVNIEKNRYRTLSYIKKFLKTLSIDNETLRIQSQIDWLISTTDSLILFDDAIFDLLSKTPIKPSAFSFYPRSIAKSFNRDQYLRLKSKCHHFKYTKIINFRFKEFCLNGSFPVDIDSLNVKAVQDDDGDFGDDFGDDFGGL